MVTSNTSPQSNPANEVDRRTMELIVEFEQHYRDAVELEPSLEGCRDHIFQAWTIQKIAGIQISIEDEEFMEMLALAQSAPGPISLNTALFIGNKRMGFKGGLVSGIALIIPSFVIILIIAMFLVKFKENAVVERVFKGIRPAVVALIAAPLYMLGKSANVNKKNIWIPIVVVALVAFLSVSPIYIIIGSIVLGLLHFLYIKKIHKR